MPNPNPPTLYRRARMFAVACLLAGPAAADLVFEVVGVDELLRENIVHHNDVLRLGQSGESSRQVLEKIAAEAEIRTRDALRPYGYYRPVVLSRHYRRDDGNAVIELQVAAGPPVLIRRMEVGIDGPGRDQEELRRWLQDWPLPDGARLDQVAGRRRSNGDSTSPPPWLSRRELRRTRTGARPRQ